MHARDQRRAAEAVAAIRVEQSDALVDVLVGDLASLAATANMTRQWLARGEPLHLLVLNAGVMVDVNATRTVDGFELLMGVNHLAHALMAKLLAPRLIASAPSRVVVVSSAAHGAGRNFVGQPGFETADAAAVGLMASFERYANSKLANVLFARHFDRLFQSDGVRAFAVDPGAIATRLGDPLRALDNALVRVALFFAEGVGRRWLLKDLDQASAAAGLAWRARDVDRTGRVDVGLLRAAGARRRRRPPVSQLARR